MKPTLLSDSLKRIATDNGADYFGVADIEPFQKNFEQTWALPVKGLQYGIAVGIVLNHWIVDRLCAAPDATIAKLYWHNCYTVVNNQLDWIVTHLASNIQSMGYQAVPVPATLKNDDDMLLGPFTHKAVARMAGLGWIGKSCLLVSPDAGPRVRWAVVITDAPLRPTGEPVESSCGSCDVCVQTCPVQAFTGRQFCEDEPVALRYDVRKCQSYLKKVSVCGLCLASCPYGRKEAVT